ncbi:glycosyltransferase family 1 protein [Tsukamurella tyrosinosolvens]|uniref:UDP:flavonoid glycosyltransferase YjiC, YdhE family n=1 Tax=Tsukamurella tyrosinosolvens TaxID=57704 RepID=A0A1H4Z7H8_TSUTY|nr:glycosyltransferase [Tsukamurella tyrosinosolvens]AUN41647.1 sterol 3-beta-glucosyltransferase [Tsukamurella tyrosinosolvens]KXO90842.1 sterol 3-beta-glucosyltransferase [Tsukamurella tyrosinosolvens]KXP07033.1 sterol 3-beta-glucosyltransferase [Tsukamurella tyrosinosolvens]KZL98234.1 sterol 3-beta-glucosyltransferase [Tsukamurella tyrosinosolvens]MCA4994389.1 glycosyltransferase family 1 protein [Tsukamurella tyrosinosolvens]
MKVCILAMGSRGDVQPTIAIGLALRARGHDVTIAAMGDPLVRLIRSAGLDAHRLNDFVPDYDDDYRDVIHRPVERMRAYGRWLVRNIATISRETETVCRDADVVLTHSDAVDFALPITRRSGATIISYRFFPGTTNSVYPMTQYTPAGLTSDVLSRSPRVVKRATWALGDSFTWTHVRAAVNFHRMSVGEAPYRSRRAKNRDANEIVDLQLYDPALTPDLVPEFSRTRPMLGFLEVPADAWLRQGEQKRTDADLLAWLTDGDAPIYWGFGSMRIADPDGMARTFARVCAERGRRGLIVAGWSDLVGADLGDHVRVVDEVVHAEVLPHCAAAVHHGGAGTTAASLRAGLPTLICPVLADQPFWGARVTDLGVGACLPMRNVTAERLHAAFDLLLDPATRRRAQRISSLIDLGDIPARRAATIIESIAEDDGVDVRTVPAVTAPDTVDFDAADVVSLAGLEV